MVLSGISFAVAFWTGDALRSFGMRTFDLVVKNEDICELAL